MNSTNKKPMVSKKALRQQSPSLFLDLYYPFHYKTGFAIEHVLRDSNLTQIQTIILWTIHSEGEGGIEMRRKDIEQRITNWFDVTSSAISKSIRGMSREGLLVITEDPVSGREKRINLTNKGQQHVVAMMERGKHLIENIVAELDDDEIAAGLNFLKRVSTIVEDLETR
mgnify:CR=1 FL=1|tara:strand:- start:153 stop:659 length:507 start_codon:yes stop_codon:yes gene_type:complete